MKYAGKFRHVRGCNGVKIEASANLGVESYRPGTGNELQPTHGVEESKPQFSLKSSAAYEPLSHTFSLGNEYQSEGESRILAF